MIKQKEAAWWGRYHSKEPRPPPLTPQLWYYSTVFDVRNAVFTVFEQLAQLCVLL